MSLVALLGRQASSGQTGRAWDRWFYGGKECIRARMKVLHAGMHAEVDACCSTFVMHVNSEQRTDVMATWILNIHIVHTSLPVMKPT